MRKFWSCLLIALLALALLCGGCTDRKSVV